MRPQFLAKELFHLRDYLILVETIVVEVIETVLIKTEEVAQLDCLPVFEECSQLSVVIKVPVRLCILLSQISDYICLD